MVTMEIRCKYTIVFQSCTFVINLTMAYQPPAWKPGAAISKQPALSETGGLAFFNVTYIQRIA